MEQQRKITRIMPPVYMLLALGAMTALHFLMPLARIVAPPWTYLGLVPLAAGLSIAMTAASAFRRIGTAVRPFEPATTLVTDGLYRYTRNPMYLGVVLILIGVWLLFGTLSPVLPIAIFLWIIQEGFIRGEEQFLEQTFGQQYRDYKGRVRRWI